MTAASGPDLLRDAVQRTPVGEHDGRSGAGLERVLLADGRRLVVKRVQPEGDLTLRLAGRRIAAEHELRTSGTFDRFPAGVTHPVVDTWVEGADTTVVVMRDLGDAVLGRRPVPRETTLLVARRLGEMHRAFVDDPPAPANPLERVLVLFAPDRVEDPAREGDALCRAVLRGWEAFHDVVPAEVADAVAALLADPRPLAAALRSGPVTLVHADAATPNLAVEGDSLVLLDWVLTTVAPGAVDVVRLLAECSPLLGATREGVLDAWAAGAGPAHDPAVLDAAILSGLLWLGWNKALDAIGHPDHAVRARESVDLAWWVSHSSAALERGLR